MPRAERVANYLTIPSAPSQPHTGRLKLFRYSLRTASILKHEHVRTSRSENATRVPDGISARLEVPRTHRTAAAIDLARIFGLRTPHSQTVSTLQPSSASSATCRRSRARLPRNFFSQKARRVLGITASRHPECWCQKQPCTKMTAEYFGRTISGRPGRSLRCRRYLSPALCSPARRSRSGVVFAWRILAMCRLRSSADRRQSRTRPRGGNHIEDALGNQNGQQRRHSVTHLVVLLRAISTKKVVVGKGLQSCRLPYREATALFWRVMNEVVAVFCNVRGNRAGRTIGALDVESIPKFLACHGLKDIAVSGSQLNREVTHHRRTAHDIGVARRKQISMKIACHVASRLMERQAVGVVSIPATECA